MTTPRVTVPVEPYMGSPEALAGMTQAIVKADAEFGHELSAYRYRTLAQAAFDTVFVGLSAAPAPSSLAGGEVAALRDALDHPLLRQVLGFVEDCAPDEVMNNLRLWQDTQSAALSPEAPAREGAEAMAFGFGRFVVDTGCWQQTPAVFICPVGEPGAVGASARDLGHDRHTLLPGEKVMTFPTVDQAKTVADALVGALTPRHEAPASEGDA